MALFGICTGTLMLRLLAPMTACSHHRGRTTLESVPSSHLEASGQTNSGIDNSPEMTRTRKFINVHSLGLSPELVHCKLETY